jgi:hypothetical protein
MTSKLAGFVSGAKEVFYFQFVYDLKASSGLKELNPLVCETLTETVEVINFIKNRPFNTRLFLKLCAEMDSEHLAVLFRSEILWLSRGGLLKGL